MEIRNYNILGVSNGQGKKRTVVMIDVNTNETIRTWTFDGFDNLLVREMIIIKEFSDNGIKLIDKDNDFIAIINYVNHGLEVPEWLIYEPTDLDQKEFFDKDGKLKIYPLKNYSYLKWQ